MTDHSEEAAQVEAEEDHPRGAMTVLLFYLLVIIGLWVWAYAILLSRN